MRWALWTAASLIALTGLAHSLLGERYILSRLFRRDALPHLFGGPDFTRRTLRFAWHITTVAWFGMAAIIALIAERAFTPTTVLWTLAGTCVASTLVAAIGSRLQHLSWLVFLVLAGLLAWAALS